MNTWMSPVWITPGLNSTNESKSKNRLLLVDLQTHRSSFFSSTNAVSLSNFPSKPLWVSFVGMIYDAHFTYDWLRWIWVEYEFCDVGSKSQLVFFKLSKKLNCGILNKNHFDILSDKSDYLRKKKNASRSWLPQILDNTAKIPSRQHI